MNITKEAGEDWIGDSKNAWNRKPALRDYYETQIFDRMIPEFVEGATLQLGTGAGFFSNYHPGMINSDIVKTEDADVVADVHNLQFEDEEFSNIAGIDVLHHFEKPGVALQECARTLKPGGVLVFVEPWAGPIGWLFYKYIHHEDCAPIPNPWKEAFPDGKSPMDGNAAIPKTVFDTKADELKAHVPDLELIKIEPFGALSFLLTGGFQKIGFHKLIVKPLYHIENIMPKWVMSIFALRALFVLRKKQ